MSKVYLHLLVWDVLVLLLSYSSCNIPSWRQFIDLFIICGEILDYNGRLKMAANSLTLCQSEVGSMSLCLESGWPRHCFD